MKRYLIIDDVRDANMLLKSLLSEQASDSFSVEVARTYDEGCALLSKSLVEKQYDVLFLDHDLGGEKSGYDLLKEVFNKCFDNDGFVITKYFNNLPVNMSCVSSNPPGRMIIESMIEKIMYMRNYKGETHEL